jgi:hypothetical protein
MRIRDGEVNAPDIEALWRQQDDDLKAGINRPRQVSLVL